MPSSLVNIRFVHVPLAQLSFDMVMEDLNAEHSAHYEALKQLFTDAFGGENFISQSPLPLWSWVSKKENTPLNSFPNEVKDTIKQTLRTACREADIAVELKTQLADHTKEQTAKKLIKIIQGASQPVENISIYDYAIGIHQPDHRASIIVYYACNTPIPSDKVRVQKFLNDFYQEVMTEIGQGTSLNF